MCIYYSFSHWNIMKMYIGYYDNIHPPTRIVQSYLYKKMGVCLQLLDSVICDWWSLQNVRSHQQTVPKFSAKTNLIGPLLLKKWNYGGSSK